MILSFENAFCHFAQVMSCGKLREKKDTRVAVRGNAPNNHTPSTKGHPSSSACSQLSDLPLFWLAYFASDTGALQDYRNPAVLHSYTGHGKHKLPGCCLHRIEGKNTMDLHHVLAWNFHSNPWFFPKNYWLATIFSVDSSPKVSSHFERLGGIVPNYLRVAA